MVGLGLVGVVSMGVSEMGVTTRCSWMYLST